MTVQNILDAGVQLISATPSRGSCGGTTAITCHLGTLADDATATIALSVRATATNAAPINNTATVSATEDPNATNNTGNSPPVNAAGAAGAPTLGEWALIALALGLTVAALKRIV